MALHLTNTLSGQTDNFVPANVEHISLYLCGPTVYNFAHVGNARPAVVFDVLYCLLKRTYPLVTYARSFTDIDDKINAAAETAGLPISQITDTYSEAYQEDMAALGVSVPDIKPRVNYHVTHIIDMIEDLIKNGHAYAAENHVLCDVNSFEDYGKLSGRGAADMLAGARVEVAPCKRNVADFVLRSSLADNQSAWGSSWGPGRPGWHINCSAMIGRHFGRSIDIHGGGQDLIFPHHENEIAQGTCAWPGETYCRHWIHNGFLTIDGAKMSKSLGYVRLVRELLDDVPGEAIRFALLSARHRSSIDLSDRRLRDALHGLDRLYGTMRALSNIEPSDSDQGGRLKSVLTALEDDLNTPVVIAELFALAKVAFKAIKSEVRAAIKASRIDDGNLLGLLNDDPELWFTSTSDNDLELRLIKRLVADREAARFAGDFGESYRLGRFLLTMGVQLDDFPDGAYWRRTV